MTLCPVVSDQMAPVELRGGRNDGGTVTVTSTLSNAFTMGQWEEAETAATDGVGDTARLSRGVYFLANYFDHVRLEIEVAERDDY